MDKKNSTWTIQELERKIAMIEFPEFQREPTVWDLDKKCKLIDSILRNFDISSIYLYKNERGTYECIDGRQRINAILSFLGLNEESDPSYHNKFTFKSSSELLEHEERKLKNFHGKKFKELRDDQKEIILKYKFNVLELSNIKENEELNLMFLRLQLGSPLNAGEKLNAMRGDMRDFIFRGKTSLGQHQYFTFLRIPQRRFSKELTAAQIAANFFERQREKSFKRVRFIDLQEFLKAYASFNDDAKQTAGLLKERLDKICLALKTGPSVDVKNRAMGVSMFFFLDRLIEAGNEGQVTEFLKFLRMFIILIPNTETF
jgi:Fe-S-cluster formation regulator IscX/YfhJ